MIDKNATSLDQRRVQFAHGAGVRADGVNMRSWSHPLAREERRWAVGGGADDVGLGDRVLRAQKATACCVNFDPEALGHLVAKVGIFVASAGDDIGAADGTNRANGGQLTRAKRAGAEEYYRFGIGAGQIFGCNAAGRASAHGGEMFGVHHGYDLAGFSVMHQQHALNGRQVIVRQIIAIDGDNFNR